MSALLTMPKPLTVWITTNCGKFFNRWELTIYWWSTINRIDHLTCLLRNLYAGQEATELDMKQQTGSKSGKDDIKAVYYHSAYLTYMQSLVQFSSVAQSCLTLCDPMNCSTPGLPVHHQLPESNQTHVHWVGDAIQPSHSLLSPSPPALNLYQHQGLFKWVSSSHQVAKVVEFQLQHQSFQWTPRTDLP